MSAPIVWLDPDGTQRCTCGWTRAASKPNLDTDEQWESAIARDLLTAEAHAEYCPLHIRALHEHVDDLPEMLGAYVPAEVMALLHRLVMTPVVHTRTVLGRWLSDIEDPFELVDE